MEEKVKSKVIEHIETYYPSLCKRYKSMGGGAYDSFIQEYIDLPFKEAKEKIFGRHFFNHIEHAHNWTS